MTFKTHLLIISAIIVSVFLLWQVMINNRPPVPEPVAAPAPTESAFSIAVSHASWGLNCLDRMQNSETNSNIFVDDNNAASSKLHTDNVLSKVSELCNGQLQCDIPISIKTFNTDPAPECRSKVLEVEYRCFSYDRPWIARAYNGQLHIDCNKSPSKE